MASCPFCCLLDRFSYDFTARNFDIDLIVNIPDGCMVPGEPWIYGSDRNGGLRVFKEYGSGPD